MATRAGAWVMLASRPSRTVTGELPEPEPVLLLLPEPEPEDDDPHPASDEGPRHDRAHAGAHKWSAH